MYNIICHLQNKYQYVDKYTLLKFTKLLMCIVYYDYIKRL